MTNTPIIKNIDIKNFRRFQNFKGVTPDFGSYNIFYGWNYSGKTTLSRIFAIFDGTVDEKNIDKDSEFFLKTTSGNLNISNSNHLKIHVFNSDYVKENLFFENNSASNIIIVSDKANDIVANIQNLKNQNKSLIKELADFKNQYNQYETEYNKIRSNYAKELDKIFTEKFTAKNILPVENSIDKSKLEEYILDENEKLVKINTLRNPTKYSSVKNIDELPIINTPFLSTLLEKSVTPSLIIKKLQEKNAEEWVKLGVSLHTDTDTCLFCGAKLKETHIEQLDTIFKSEYDSLGEQLLNFDNTLTPYCIQIPSPASIIDNYQNIYNDEHKNFSDEIIKFNNRIDALKKIIKSKYMLRHLNFKSKICFNINEINCIIKKLNDLIDKHNDFIANETIEKNKIENELKKAIIAELLSDPSYNSSIEKMNEAKKGIDDIEKQIKNIDKQIELEEAKISDVKKGAEEINKILKRLFVGFSNVVLKVEQIHNNKGELIDITKLYRNNGKPAENLSDGEKTAIAFAHYFTKVQKSINDKTSKNEVLFIDDPISSLDKNHIYSVSVMIKEVIDKFNQTFVTTHNYELYRLLKRKKENNTNYYYIKRDGNCSVIEEMPIELKKYDSEYEYFFHQLYLFNQNNTNADIYLIGHCARRFLDKYLEYKIPNNQNPLDKLIKYVKNIGEDEIKYSTLYRILNDESHVHPEILFDKGYLTNAVALLLGNLKTYDKLHYQTLLDSCDIKLEASP